jgi:dipeptidyl aminopeptidase/acylaminoacyl peptidase
MLGGPERATYPRPSPDGHLLAFYAPDSEGFEQVWVMKPETGNRAMLTHDRELGWINAVSWAPDGSRIYFDRNEDQPKGVFSVPVLGGEEQTVLPDAAAPDALPDGSLLLTRLNAEDQIQLFRYWPDSGKLQPYSLLLGFSNGGACRAFPDGRRAAAVGAPVGAATANRLYLLDLGSGDLRPLSGEMARADSSSTVVAPSHDGLTVLLAAPSRNGIELSAFPLDGSAARPLMTLTNPAYSLDPRPDGSIYLDQVQRDVELVRFGPTGGHAERIARIDSAAALDSFAVLPDGRLVWPERSGGRERLMSASAGKDPVALVNTNEDNSRPVAAAGPGGVALYDWTRASPYHRARGRRYQTDHRPDSLRQRADQLDHLLARR